MDDPSSAEGPWPPWVEDWVLPYLRNRALWPVLFALLGHGVIVLAPLMLAVWRVGSVEAAVALVVLAGGTLYAAGVEVRGLRRPGGVGVALLLTWSAAVALAAFAERTGIL